MKLKITETIRLAQPNPALEQWYFKKDEVIDVEDEHLIDRLLCLNVAEKYKKVKKVKVEKAEVKEHLTPENKMHITTETK